jgi:hypothetical protein
VALGENSKRFDPRRQGRWVQAKQLGRASGAGHVVAQVALNIFTNYFYQVAGTDLDFPKVPALTSSYN